MAVEILEVDGRFADYLKDESLRRGWAETIAFPSSTEEVREAMGLAMGNGWPVTVQGGRTGITAGAVPHGGLILNLSRMDGIGQARDGVIEVQPGAHLSDIRAALRETGLFFPSDLTETSATIGGMVANNASGARSFRHGSVRNWIQALEVVLPNGEHVRLKRGIHKAVGLDFTIGSIAGTLPEWNLPDVKTAAGYFTKPDMDLVDLFIGAEGTLGIVVGATLRLLPEPAEINGLTAFVASEEEALELVRRLREGAVRPLAIEYFDFHALELMRRMRRDYPAFSDLPDLAQTLHSAVYFEFDAPVPTLAMEAAGQALECWWSAGEREIALLKRFRHAVPEAVNLLVAERKQSVPGLAKLGTDMSVPDAQLGAVLRMYREGLTAAGLEYVVFGHIGDNHLHVNILPRSMEEFEAGKALYMEWARLVVAMGGSVSAEHGIGKAKTEFLRLMLGDEGLRKAAALRRLFDPSGRLNPGNIIA